MDETHRSLAVPSVALFFCENRFDFGFGFGFVLVLGLGKTRPLKEQ